LIAGGVLSISSIRSTAAPVDETEPATKTPATTDVDTALDKEAALVARDVKLAVTVGGKEDPLELVDKPILKYGDITRDNDHGSVWIWQREGRPQAIMELYRGAGKKFWVFVMHSLAAQPIKGNLGVGGSPWTPRESGMQWADFSQAPAPADRDAARLRQLKDLAQRFSAHEFWDPNNSRFELRLLVQPAYKYSIRGSRELDGAVFLLCHENNPEVVLQIEAVRTGDAEPKFQYALARLGHAELHVALDGREVWKQSRITTMSPLDPYFLVVK